MFDPLGLMTRQTHLARTASGQDITIQSSTTDSLLDSDNLLLLDGIIYTGANDEHTVPERTMSQTTHQA